MNSDSTYSFVPVDQHSIDPVFYRLDNPSDKAAFEALLSEKPYILVTDDLFSQVRELVKSRNPKITYNAQQLDAAAHEYLGTPPWNNHGVWVYYPWSHRLIHMLDEQEFVEVRTNRNVYKITVEERERLSTLKVGVIGLSVGQSIATTMAMERSFGELRVADFDSLELSNLNRIRSGLHNLGMKKTVMVAREIKEIDPFLTVKLFSEGVTPENLDRFFTEGGNLDLLVDECDGLDIKILARQKCKALQIPLVQDMSDRGTLDIERFDLEPNRPIMHGYIDHLNLDVSKIRHLTNEEKIPYLLPMIGVETISTRLKASMLEVGQSITTWPQLASAVVMGGGMAADTVRRIALGQFKESGRWHIDLEDLLKNTDSTAEPAGESLAEEWPQLQLADMRALADRNKPSTIGVELDAPSISAIVEAGAMAPSAGNNQPWKWLWRGNALWLFHDKARSISFGDYDDICSRIGLGAAIENMVLKSRDLGYTPQVELFPEDVHSPLIACLVFEASGPTNTPESDVSQLAAGIRQRCTNRTIGPRKPLPTGIAQKLHAAANSIPGARLHLIEDANQIVRLGKVVTGAERIRFMHPQSHYEFYNKEIRWTPDEAQRTRDGLDIATIDLSPVDVLGLQIAQNPTVIDYLRKWEGGEGFEKISRKAVESASAIGLITMPEYSAEAIVNGGRAVQRVWIESNLNGISFHPVSGSLFYFARLFHGKGIGMDEKMKREFERLRNVFEEVFTPEQGIGEVFMFRLCIADEPEVRSLRRPVEEMLTIDEQTGGGEFA